MKIKNRAFIYDCEDEGIYCCGRCNSIVNPDELYCVCCGIGLNWDAAIPILLKDLPEQETN